MATNLIIDDHLIDTAVKVGRHRTKKDAVTAALQEYIRYHKQLEITTLFGKVEYDSTYDYKKQRRKK